MPPKQSRPSFIEREVCAADVDAGRSRRACGTRISECGAIDGRKPARRVPALISGEHDQRRERAVGTEDRMSNASFPVPSDGCGAENAPASNPAQVLMFSCMRRASYGHAGCRVYAADSLRQADQILVSVRLMARCSGRHIAECSPRSLRQACGAGSGGAAYSRRAMAVMGRCSPVRRTHALVRYRRRRRDYMDTSLSGHA